MSFTQERQSTCTAWVETLKTRDVGRGQNIYTMSETYVSINSLLFLSARHLLGVSFIMGLKLICTALTTQHYRKYLYYLIHKKATALQPKVFLTGISRLLVTSK